MPQNTQGVNTSIVRTPVVNGEFLEKQCSRCGKLQARSSFWKCAKKKDGLQSTCKSCQNEMARIRMRKRVEGVSGYTLKSRRSNIKEANKRYRQSDKGIASRVKRDRVYAQRHPERCYARKKARRRFKELPEQCERCGALPEERHHPDYSQPFLVEFLCKSCHTRAHNEG